MSDPTRTALEELGHQPTGDGDMCLHRWRNRTTRAVHCPFLAGWRAALASREERPGLDELVEVALLAFDPKHPRYRDNLATKTAGTIALRRLRDALETKP